MRKLYGLLGRNISYSLSPLMHNAAFRHFGIDAEYSVFDKQEQEVTGFFRDAVSSGSVAGFNVTVPYKIKIKELIESHTGGSIHDSAKILGAINTVSVNSKGVVGYNTDGQGFYHSLRDETGFDPKGKNIFVFGAGGAGRAISFFIASRPDRPRQIVIYDPDTKNAEFVTEELNASFARGIGVSADAGTINRYLTKSDLAVNATPLGTKSGDDAPFDVTLLGKTAVVYDLVYSRETSVVKSAREKGLIAVNGLGMLVNQGALAFEIWTGCAWREARDVMREAVADAL
ncbi:MAG: shikimate dehydrogenase [Candidatus Omnitrophica bacterium]|nr:shikimate dehydrogenase [Candidatus Omnitrophota bacterium]